MKPLTLILFFVLFFISCSPQPKILFQESPHTYLIEKSFTQLPNFENEDFDEVLRVFKKNCHTKKAQKIYGSLCQELVNVQDARKFLVNNFTPYMIVDEDFNDTGLLTGYYEPVLYGSLHKSDKYKYPIYATPKNLVEVDLGAIYPELKHYRLRGLLQNNKVLPYYTREEFQAKNIKAPVICYCDSKIDRFFLEIQGSGKVQLENNETLFIGYANQNGHKYSSIGRYLVQIGALKSQEVSLRSIKKWLQEHPLRVDEVLNHNDSMVFFSKKEQGATGALGVELTPKRSVAVDKKYILLGSMLYLNSKYKDENISNIVFAQDTGGAIKGAVRADLFLGDAKEIAGSLKSPLELWVLLPKKKRGNG